MSVPNPARLGQVARSRSRHTHPRVERASWRGLFAIGSFTPRSRALDAAVPSCGSTPSGEEDRGSPTVSRETVTVDAE